MSTYNEDVRKFVHDRYEELGEAARHILTLQDARTHGKFTRRHTTVVRDLISAHLNEHFSADDALPDLTLWEGFNTPERAYLAEGGEIGDSSSDSGFFFWDNYTGGVLTSATIPSGKNGSNFVRAPTIAIEDDNGSGAAVRAIMGWVDSCDIVNEGDDYTSSPTVTVSTPDDVNGTQATVGVYRGKITGAAVTATGSGYSAGDTISFGAPDEGSDYALADLIIESGAVLGVAIRSPGSGYTSSVSGTINSTTGTGATVSVSYDDSVIAGCYVISRGAGYTTTPTVTMSGGGGTGAQFTTSFDPGVVAAVHVASGGTGYGTDPYPTLTITPTAPDVATSTTAQLILDGYIPDGWTDILLDTDDSYRRYIWRIERTGRVGSWSEWDTPTLVAEYSSA